MEEVISYENSNMIRAIAAILIVCHHLSLKAASFPSLLSIFNYIAFPIVALFFFLSGYSMCRGVITRKEKFWQKFWSKRIRRLFIPYALLGFLWCIFSAIVLKSTFSKILQEIFCFYKLDLVPEMWYVWVSLFAYFMFYISFAYDDVKGGAKKFGVFTLIYLVLLASVLPDNYAYLTSSFGAMFLGIVYSIKEKEIVKWFSKDFTKKEIVIALIFMGLFGVRLIAQYMGLDAVFIHMIWRNVISAFFVFGIANILHIKLKENMLLTKIGNISYEIYLVHPFVIYALWNLGLLCELKAVTVNCIVLGGTLIGGFLLNYVSICIKSIKFA